MIASTLNSTTMTTDWLCWMTEIKKFIFWHLHQSLNGRIHRKFKKCTFIDSSKMGWLYKFECHILPGRPQKINFKITKNADILYTIPQKKCNFSGVAFLLGKGVPIQPAFLVRIFHVFLWTCSKLEHGITRKAG